MKKNFGNVVKKAMAVVAVAAAVVTAVPAGQAEAACSHDYHTICLGYYTHKDSTHEYDRWYREYGDWFWKYERATCTIRDVYHGDRQTCTKCSSVSGGIGTHLGSTMHMSCTTWDKTYCAGSGTDLTAVY